MSMLLLLLVVPVLSNMVSEAGMVMVRRGDSAVLQCEVDPGDTLLSVTWKLRLYNSSCVISYKIEENKTKTSYSSCSTRMRSDHLSLIINNTEISDEGTYTCEVVNDEDTFFRNFSLQVLVEPSKFLKLSSDGSPECGAIGGNPPAEISWIPHSDDINTTKLEDPDGTWSVISTYRKKRINGTSMTCVMSHPTFVNPWKEVISLNSGRKLIIIYVVLGFVISFILILICLLIWKLSYLRSRVKAMVHTDPHLTRTHGEEEKQDCEPYITYNQKENAIYCMATKFVALDAVDSAQVTEHAHNTLP
ncbi:cell surface glycoprotein CD200 receptor 1-A-like [Phyllobates terribilis]|uniref:cell surface glycoprotein CD200 receptor 1-A-like n=1 Tax=Phyllobates terribilis TaxID=111132 RepID=UPI003CCA9C98